MKHVILSTENYPELLDNLEEVALRMLRKALNNPGTSKLMTDAVENEDINRQKLFGLAFRMGVITVISEVMKGNFKEIGKG